MLAIGGSVANGLRAEVPENAVASVVLTDLPSAPGQRMVSARVQIDPEGLVDADPEWVTILAWQGGLANDRGLVIDNLRRVGPGYYESTKPIPVWGQWKTLVRVQDGNTMAGVPIYLAADPGIGAAETPALAAFQRPLVEELTILQRERNQDHPSWLFTVASLVVLFCTLVLIAALTWGAGRINARDTGTEVDTKPRNPVTQA